MTLVTALPRARENAKSIGELAESLYMSRRKVERALESIVQSGIPIVACETGIYVATSPQEARQYAQSLRGRISAVQHRITALERWAERNEQSGQLSWWEAA